MLFSISPNEDGVTETDTKGYLEFDNVSNFAYPGETGSLFYTIFLLRLRQVKLLPLLVCRLRKIITCTVDSTLYDVTLGRILVDGVDAVTTNLEALRRKIGFIPQRSSTLYWNYR